MSENNLLNSGKEQVLNILNDIYDKIGNIISVYGPSVLEAVLILILGIIIARGVYLLSMYLFKRFKIVELIDKLHFEFNSDDIKEDDKETTLKLSEKIKIDKVVSKSISYYVFLLFFRWAVSHIGIKEIELFLTSVVSYLPKLFIGLLIGYFGVRFANFIHDLVYHTLDLANQKNAKIIAVGGKIIILFFTVLAVLNQIDLVSQIIYNTVLIGFISMVSLAGGLAFGLGGKEIAKDILESFRK